MRAMAIRQFGDPDVFEPVELPAPEPRAGHLVIRVAASSVNPIDQKLRSGAAAAVAPDFPAVLGCDVAGTVAAVGDGVAGFAVGDAVFACPGGVKGHGGALAELILADADLVAHAPATLPLREAAALPLVGITAWEALFDRADILPGDRVLIHGGTGGVGHLGIQLARLRGAVVHTTVSTPEKAAIARDLGADATILYHGTPVADYVAEQTGGEGYELVFDTVGGDNLAASFAAARPGGTVVTIAARSTQDLTPVHMRALGFHAVFMLLPLLTGRGRAHHGEILRRLARLVDTGRVRPLIDPERFTSATIAAAHRKLEAGTAVGKLVVDSWGQVQDSS